MGISRLKQKNWRARVRRHSKSMKLLFTEAKTANDHVVTLRVGEFSANAADVLRRAVQSTSSHLFAQQMAQE